MLPAGSLLQGSAKQKSEDDEQLPLLTTESMQAKIDEIGFGPAQIIAIVCCGGIMFSEGSEVLIMGSITKIVSEQWQLTAFLRGFMTSIVFVGFAIGNLVSGVIGDSLGRRPAILLAYIIIGVAGLLTSFTENAAAMVSIRIFVGLGCGVGFPSVYSLIPEVSPTHLRGVKSSVLIMFMPLGELFASLGVLMIDTNLTGERKPLGYASWRLQVQYCSIPPFVFLVFSLFLLRESPHYLLSRGRIRELNQVLGAMAWMNGKPNLQTSFADTAAVSKQTVEADDSPWQEAAAGLFEGPYFRTTPCLFLANFTKDFSYFGLNYVFPQYFQDTAGTLSVGAEMVIISLLALPGVLLAILLTRSQAVGHISSLSATAGVCGLSAVGLLDGLNQDWCAYFVKFFAMAVFIVVVVYTSEAFPTRIRNSAVGLCLSFGRLGSISSPLIFELLKQRTSSFSPWWIMLISLMASLSLAATFVLKLETKWKVLDSGDKSKGTQYSSA